VQRIIKVHFKCIFTTHITTSKQYTCIIKTLSLGKGFREHKQTDAFLYACLTLAPRYWAFLSRGYNFDPVTLVTLFFNCRRMFGYTANQMQMKYRNASVCVSTWKPIVKTRTNKVLLFSHNLKKENVQAQENLHKIVPPFQQHIVAKSTTILFSTLHKMSSPKDYFITANT